MASVVGFDDVAPQQARQVVPSEYDGPPVRGDGQDAPVEDGLLAGVGFSAHPAHVVPHVLHATTHHSVAFALRGGHEHWCRLAVDPSKRVASVDVDDVVGEVFHLYERLAGRRQHEASAEQGVVAQA